jgi:uncharacterized protein (DUF1330 family)
MTSTYINSSREQMGALAELGIEGPIVMLNLLRFVPDGGAEQYARYARAAAPFLRDAGATVTYLGDVSAAVIGPEEWDEIILVEYPSVRAFLDMVSDPDYPDEIRAGALADSRLHCTTRRAS